MAIKGTHMTAMYESDRIMTYTNLNMKQTSKHSQHSRLHVLYSQFNFGYCTQFENSENAWSKDDFLVRFKRTERRDHAMRRGRQQQRQKARSGYILELEET